ncbi:MAG: hypothetical protein F7C07_02605 [Desulfurococcales archaeon]|nr:hypothetical protein [Desulfurococcales archaeon]
MLGKRLEARLKKSGMLVRVLRISYATLGGSVVREERLLALSPDYRVKILVKRLQRRRLFTLIIRVEGRKGLGEIRSLLESKGGLVDVSEGRLLAVFKRASGSLLEEILDELLG